MDGKTNVIFILTDDQGQWAAGCYGNPEIKTPHLDRLAKTGMRFDNFFCTSPVCSPARASLLTGRIPSQHGVHDWIREGNSGKDAIEYLRGVRGYTEDLTDGGYNCGFSGKWHLGNSQLPQKGFDHWYVHQKGGGDYYSAPIIRDGKYITETGYITDLITDDALEFLESAAGQEKPFYLSLHYTAPHSPWIDQHPKEIVDSYDMCSFESCPRETPHPWNLFVKVPDAVPSTIWDEPEEHLKGYFAAVTAMDTNVGRVLDWLEARGLRESTLVVFLSDNGFNCGHHGIWGKGNGTFPQNMYDTSVKVPALFSQPGVIPEGSVNSDLVSGYDFAPTLLEFLDLPRKQSDGLPGQSFAPALTGKVSSRREDVVVYDEYGPVRMIRGHDWKYVHRYPYGPHELYDMVGDPDERTNRVDDPEVAEIVTQMRGRLEHWFHRYVDTTRDGVREGVTGKGQIGLAGIDGEGAQAFYDGE